jgi:NADPH-dependent curcumin reductase CurA
LGSLSNRQFRLAARPVGLPKASDWNLTTEPVPDPADGQVLVKVLQLSLDPAMRGWMNDGRSYIPPVGIGEVMRAIGVGKVIASKNAAFAVGDLVAGGFGIQEYCLVTDTRQAGLNKVDPRLAPPEKWLNALGMPGMTAYFGLLDVGQPKEGETVVVSGAAGAVGQTVGQVARIKGCRVIGIAGGKAKCDFVVNELKFDACIDYKSGNGQDGARAVRDGLKQHCPKGVDVYFDNVGGDILDVVLTRINKHARIVICGAISQYNNTTPVKGPSNYMMLLVARARMQGMVVFDYADRYGVAIKDIALWMKEGKFISREDVVDGIENFPATLNQLFSGGNFGKLVLRVAEG